MRHNLLKSGLLLVTLFVITGVQAQKKLYIQAKDGTRSSIPLTDIRKLTLPSRTIIVYENDGNTQSFPFADLSQARFTYWLTGSNSIDQDDNKGMVLYPNPVSEQLTLRLASESGQLIEIRILDVKGNTVLTQTGHTVPGINQIKIQLPHLAKGLYICRVNTGKSTETGKFIKY